MPGFEATRDDVSASSDFSGEIGAHRDSDSSSELDLESGVSLSLVKLQLSDKPERDCRICHLGLEGNSQEFQPLIELGCLCKGDLGAAHRKCAETWFKIKGNMTCEICGSTAVNVSSGEQTNQSTAVSASAASSASPGGSLIILADQRFWSARRPMNCLLASMIFAFVISWLFHFKVLS